MCISRKSYLGCLVIFRQNMTQLLRVWFNNPSKLLLMNQSRISLMSTWIQWLNCNQVRFNFFTENSDYFLGNNFGTNQKCFFKRWTFSNRLPTTRPNWKKLPICTIGDEPKWSNTINLYWIITRAQLDQGGFHFRWLE